MINKINEILKSNKFNYFMIIKVTGLKIISEQFGYLESLKIISSLTKIIENKTETFKLPLLNNTFKILINTKANCTLYLKEISFELEKELSEYLDIKDIGLRAGISPINKGEDLGIILNNSSIALSVAVDQKLDYIFFDTENKFIKNKLDINVWKNKTLRLINENAIEPFYQPIIDINSREIIKYEVLARGVLDNEIISPINFLNTVEKLDFLSYLTEIMIIKSFKLFSNNSLCFSLNVSGYDLNNPKFVDLIVDYSNKYNIDCNRITLELLETITNIEHNKIKEKIKILKEKGFNIAIDDFGIETSNFKRLSEINCDFLKIDAFFIKDIVTNFKHFEFVKSIVKLAKDLNIKTIAEHVESEDILEYIKLAGVDYAQGYLIGKPLSNIK